MAILLISYALSYEKDKKIRFIGTLKLFQFLSFYLQLTSFSNVNLNTGH